MVKKIDENTFENEVLKSEKPVLVDFYADWCGPCKMMAPIVEQISEEYGDQITFGKCNIDENMDIAQRYRVMSIPTLIIFKDGKPAEVWVGACSKVELEEKLKKY